MEHYIDLTEIDKKYKDKCSLIKAGKCKNVNIFLENSRELKRLKAENETLKAQNILLKESNVALNKDWEEKKNLAYEIACKNEKLKQTLAEIKEIAEQIEETCEEDKCRYSCASDYKEQILQKISEVIDD